ncbi:MAG: hypothetical protein NUV32_10640, partial [Exilispira sp.]|nr:hypothetical protein [Exilispira sp.]
FASTPKEENAPTATSEDGMFLDMTQINEEELALTNGNAWLTIEDWNYMGGNNVGIDSNPPIPINDANSNTNSQTQTNNNSTTNTSSNGWLDAGASKPK